MRGRSFDSGVNGRPWRWILVVGDVADRASDGGRFLREARQDENHGLWTSLSEDRFSTCFLTHSQTL